MENFPNSKLNENIQEATYDILH